MRYKFLYNCTLNALQVTRYSSIVGQLWYVLTFIFRLIIVASLGGAGKLVNFCFP